jgi:DNA modification methylase
MKKIRILQGDCIESLKKLEDQSINTCITSPPYWGLRDYGTGEWVGGDPNCSHMRTTKISKNTSTGHKAMFEQGNVVGDAIYKNECPKCGAIRKDSQLGLEDTPEEFVDNLVKVFREVKRVLRDDGTVWLNLGDSYSSGGRTTTTNQSLRGDKDYGVTRPKPSKGIKPKDLIGIPWRVALALQQDGWYLRQDIIWHKPNPMPESVQDRCTKAHEYIFLLSKSPNYYFDNNAIKEDLADASKIKLTQSNINNQKGSDRVPGKSNGPMKPVVAKKHGKYKTEENEAKHRQGIHANRGDNLVEVRSKLPKQKELVKFLKSKTKAKILAENTDIPLTKIEHWFRADKSGFAYPSIEDWKKVREYIDDWSQQFNVIDEGLTFFELKTDEVVVSDKRNKRSVWTVTTKPFKGAHFATFPMELIKPCVLAGCPVDGTVLDPFAGSGTTGIVAVGHNRNAVLCELNEEYIELAKKRIREDVGMYAKVYED